MMCTHHPICRYVRHEFSVATLVCFSLYFQLSTFLICFRCISENNNNYYIKSIYKIPITGKIRK